MKGAAFARVLAVCATGLIPAAMAQERPARMLTVNIDKAGVARVGTAEAEVKASPALAPASVSAAPPLAKAAECNFGKIPSPSEAEALVRRIATEEEFYPDFVVAVARAESRFRMDQVSPKGAVGLMQLMPSTATRFKVDLCDPSENVRGGVRFLRSLHERYRNPMFILAAYNAGEEAVEQHRGVPPFPETVRYVATVINDFYEWPMPSAPRVAGGASSRPAAGTRADGVKGDPGWSQGFVMHVEN